MVQGFLHQQYYLHGALGLRALEGFGLPYFEFSTQGAKGYAFRVGFGVLGFSGFRV